MVSSVECRSLDRGNPVTNHLHVIVPLLATRCGTVTVLRHNNNKILVLYLILGNKL